MRQQKCDMKQGKFLFKREVSSLKETFSKSQEGKGN